MVVVVVVVAAAAVVGAVYTPTIISKNKTAESPDGRRLQ